MYTYLTKLKELNLYFYKNIVLRKIQKKSQADKQINTESLFEKFSDFQNIVFSYVSFLEILWKNEEEKLNNKTINELFKENFEKKPNRSLNYENIQINDSKIYELNNKLNNKKYRNIILGKLVRYGFGNIKIENIIQGENGFDAVILRDVSGTIRIHYSCTNIFEIEDYCYNCYPIINKLFKNSKIKFKNKKIKEIYNSQQKQAKKILEQVINSEDSNEVFLSGYSLGGSLLEYAYLSVYKKNNKNINKIKRIILFNPYHNDLKDKEIKIIKESKKFKFYVTEGDMVSSFFCYEGLKKISSPIYINYKNTILRNRDTIDKGEGLLNPVMNELKKDLCSKIRISCESISNKKHKIPNIIKEKIILELYELIGKIENKDTNITKLIGFLSNCYQKIEPIFKKFNIKLDLTFIYVLRYIELIITGTHLIYPVEEHKNIAFNKTGKINHKVLIENKEYTVGYPTFDTISQEIFGMNIYDEIEKLIVKKHTK